MKHSVRAALLCGLLSFGLALAQTETDTYRGHSGTGTTVQTEGRRGGSRAGLLGLVGLLGLLGLRRRPSSLATRET